MFDGKPIFKPKDLKSDLYFVEVVIGVGKDKISILKNAHDLDLGRGLGQPFEELCQTDVPLASERIVLNIFALVNDSHSLRVTRFDAFE